MAQRVNVRSYGLRPTRARRAVLTVLERERGRQLTAQELHTEARSLQPRLGLATVYRTLGVLEEEGVVEVVSHEERESAYRLCSPGHHHHLICVQCGAVIEIPECDLAELERRLERRHEFRIEEHDVTFRGRCGGCSS
jgi:Fur family transcriptional regulator, ferric uptake regulator